jgi:murein DD-endopeptidase MepM/ murein hydrolase activator NlpD
VTAGDLLAQCGNSGNSSEPHLHFQLMDQPRVLLAGGLPFRFDGFEAAGGARSGVPRARQPFPAGARPDPAPGRSDVVPAEHPDRDQRQRSSEGEHHGDRGQR